MSKLRKSLKANSPGLTEEKAFWDAGHSIVVGFDEVGRGAWAGPLTIGAVVVPKDRRLYKLRDSKQLTEAEREALYDKIIDWAEAWAVGHATAAECDRLGMSAAQKLAAARALDSLGVVADAVLLDGKWDFVGHPMTKMVVKGDAKCLSIAAASILAKVTRDRMMRAEALELDAYNFENNKGYPCAKQGAALQAYGPSRIHRRSWVFMDHLLWSACPRVIPDVRKHPNQITLFDDPSFASEAFDDATNQA
ncbi:MAG: ribonuclease HII [Acidimicrobiales bacterium]